MGSAFSSEILQNEFWIRCNLALEIHAKRALLDVLHNRINENSYNGLSEVPSNLYQYLNNFFTPQLKNTLIRKKILRQNQFDILLPLNGLSDSSTWDITLIVVVIRQCIQHIQQPNGPHPPATDQSIGAFIVRTRQLCNEFNHGNLQNFKSKAKFNLYWQRLSEILHGLKYSDIRSFDDLKTDELLTNYLEEGKNILGQVLKNLKLSVRSEIKDYRKKKSALKHYIKKVDKRFKKIESRIDGQDVRIDGQYVRIDELKAQIKQPVRNDQHGARINKIEDPITRTALELIETELPQNVKETLLRNLKDGDCVKETAQSLVNCKVGWTAKKTFLKSVQNVC